MKYTVKDLKADIANLPDDEEIVVILADGADVAEEGDVLEIQEAGGYVQGMRVIYAMPR